MNIINVNGTELPTPNEDGMDFEEEDLQIKAYRDANGYLHKVTVRESVMGLTVSWDDLTGDDINLIRRTCKGHGEYVTVRYYSDTSGHSGTKTMYSGNLKYKAKRIDEDTGKAIYSGVSLHFAEQ